MNPADTELFVDGHKKELSGRYTSLIGSINVDSSDEIKRIHLLDTDDLIEIKSSLIWYLCFSREIHYCGSLGDEIPLEEWNAQESNITLIDNNKNDVELLYTILENELLDKLFKASLGSREWFENRYGEKWTSEIYEKFESMISLVRSDQDLRIAYFYDF